MIRHRIDRNRWSDKAQRGAWTMKPIIVGIDGSQAAIAAALWGGR